MKLYLKKNVDIEYALMSIFGFSNKILTISKSPDSAAMYKGVLFKKIILNFMNKKNIILELN